MSVKTQAMTWPGRPGETRNICKVEKTTSTAWGTPETAASRATVEPTVTAANEQLFRTFHPALAKEHYVYILQERFSDRRVWVVLPSSDSLPNYTHAGGLEIHIHPSCTIPIKLPALTPTPCGPPDPFSPINARKLLSEHQINQIRDAFPRAIGVQIFLCECAIVLFNTRHDMISTYVNEDFESLGGLHLGYAVLDIMPSSPSTASGQEICPRADCLMTKGTLGLKLQLPDGTVAITTTTHGFVEMAYSASTVVKRLASFYYRITDALSKFRQPFRFLTSLAEVDAGNQELSNSALGQKVFLVRARDPIGTITRSFDAPSKFLAYPAGYEHDLSLITGEQLPDLYPPAGVNMQNEFGAADQALAGDPVFCSSFYTDFPNTPHWRTYDATIASEQTCAAAIEGAEYFWENKSSWPTSSLLWRTIKDTTSVRGYSGSVVFISGSSQKDPCKPLLFQNFQHEVTKWPLDEPKQDDAKTIGTIKGGFLLPEEVKRSQILMHTSDRRRH